MEKTRSTSSVETLQASMEIPEKRGKEQKTVVSFLDLTWTLAYT